MGLVWFDGFDHYTSSQLTRRYDVGSGNMSSTTRYNTGQSFNMSSGSHSLTKIFASSSQAYNICYAFQITSNGGSPFIMELRNGTSTHFFMQITNLRFELLNSGFGRLGITNKSVKINVWYFLELYIVIENTLSSGHCQLMVNGEQWLNVTSGDTQNGATASADRFVMEGGSQGTLYDDLAIYQSAVSSTPTFYGDQRVQTLYPNGNGNYSQFNGSDGNSVNNYLLVDEAQANDDTDYVEIDVSGNKDSYTYDNLLSTPNSVSALQINCVQKKGDAGARTGRLFHRISGTDYESSDFIPTTSYGNAAYLTTVSPATSSAWAASEVNGMEAGIKVQS